MSERDAVIFSYVFHIEEEEYSKKWYESTFQTHLEVMDIGCVLRTQLTFHPNFFGIVLSSSTCGFCFSGVIFHTVVEKQGASPAFDNMG